MRGPECRDWNYHVEVSGWDIWERFFVEEAYLDWNENGDKWVPLRSKIRLGSIVFIRLSQPLAVNNVFPVAYRVERIKAMEEGKTAITLLAPLRATGRDEAARAGEGTEAEGSSENQTIETIGRAMKIGAKGQV